MSADLETLGLSAAAAAAAAAAMNEASDDIPFLVSSHHSSIVDGSDDTTIASSSADSHHKRTAAEISEDEECQSNKARRVTRAVTITEPELAPSTTTAAVVSPPTPTKTPLAPKPASSKKKKSSSAAVAIHFGGSDASIPTIAVDTSTEHVKALTSAKGATMCFEHVSGTDRDNTVAIPNLASADLTPEEKAKFSRDRNRLHARNTRIRKKAYVDELKRTLDVLVQEREDAAAEKERKMQIEREERDVRFSVLEEFLRLRGCNERSPIRWNAILEENFTLCLPNIDFQAAASAAAGGGAVAKKVLTGVPELMKECNDFTNRMQAGKWGGTRSTGLLTFQCDRPSLLMEQCNVVVDWTATSTDPAKANLVVRGTCRACFNPQSNKLHSVEMFFDSTPIFA